VDRVVVAPAVHRALRAHAREGAAADPPRESCGVLAGERPDGGEKRRRDAAGERPVTVTWARRIPNVATRPARRYELDPAATLAAIEAATDAGRDHVGFYHSHPEGPAAPSTTDRAEARWPGALYCIVTPGGDLGAWEWTGGSFRRYAVECGGAGESAASR
jgi:proteasome lid subunit RPN8/RPN11